MNHKPGNTCRFPVSPEGTLGGCLPLTKETSKGRVPSATTYYPRGCWCPWPLFHLLNARFHKASVAVGRQPGFKWIWPLKALQGRARAMLDKVKLKLEEDGSQVGDDQKTQAGLQCLHPHDNSSSMLLTWGEGSAHPLLPDGTCPSFREPQSRAAPILQQGLDFPGMLGAHTRSGCVLNTSFFFVPI